MNQSEIRTVCGKDAIERYRDSEDEETTDHIVGFLIPLMYLSMGHMMWNWPLPDF